MTAGLRYFVPYSGLLNIRQLNLFVQAIERVERQWVLELRT